MHELPDGWLEAARDRVSRRSYDGARIEPDVLGQLAEHCESFRPADPVRAALIERAPDTIFKGIVGSYGSIKGAPSALAFVGPAADDREPAALGYTGQAAVLEATRLGLDTCWVGGFFYPGKASKLVELHGGETVHAVSPLGHASASLSGAERVAYRQKADKPKPRKPLDEIAPGYGAWPEWAREGATLARLAPSAYNRQPWRFRFENGRIIVSHDGDEPKKFSKRRDCGIAMLNFEVGARAAGVAGGWEYLRHGRDVAQFVTG